MSAQDTEAIRAALELDAEWRKQEADPANYRRGKHVYPGKVMPRDLHALVDDRGRLVARLEADERALAFYADESTYQEGTEPHPRHFATGVVPIEADLGARARAALAAAAPGETEQTP